MVWVRGAGGVGVADSISTTSWGVGSILRAHSNMQMTEKARRVVARTASRVIVEGSVAQSEHWGARVVHIKQITKSV